MATANKVFVSPGVYTSERDLSFVAQSVGVTTLGIVGEAQKGPAFEPIFITNFDEFTSYFGGTNPTKFVNTQIPKYEASYIAKSYLQQSNQLFMTRVLGLSGYDAGPSWSILTVGSLSGDTLLSGTSSSVSTITFTGVTGDSTSILITSNTLPTEITDIWTNNYTTFAGGSSTLQNDILTYAYSEITDSLTSTEGEGTYIWGTLGVDAYTNVTSINGNYVSGNDTNVFGVSGLTTNDADFSSSYNDSWYYSLFSYNGTNYDGFSFGMALNTLTEVGGVYTGEFEVYLTPYTGSVMTEYHNMVVSTMRSRGISTFQGDNDGPEYKVSGLTDVQINSTGSYSLINNDPFATFEISALTVDNEVKTFRTSLELSNSNFISKVFGRGNFSKPINDVPLFVEEMYSNLLVNGYREGKIRGLNTELLSLGDARSDNDNTSIGWYMDRFQTPETPYIVSELRGSKVYNLFKFISISDGSAGNTEVKISIANISFNNGTFDVIVRDYFDTDSSPVVLEKFTNCTMDISLNSYIGKKIGTSNGEFELKSRYIMVELNEDAPVDALPCGFNGYVTRQYTSYNSPHLIYKTKYDKPGDVLYNPPFGTANGDNIIRSGGDKVRKTYLGVSNTVGIDTDFLQYKGKQNPSDLANALESSPWPVLTKGFHMDSGATVVLISNGYTTSGETAFEVGETTFRSEPTSSTDPYYKLNSRKFTVVPSGGFDGWDIYREYRTNGDRYQLGQTGFLQGAAPSFSYPTADGWGAFKTIVGPDQLNWANTDYYAYLWGQYTFANPESVNINVLTTPGIDLYNNSNLVENAIDMVETDRADSIYICTTPDYQMFTNTTGNFDSDFIYPEEAVDIVEETGIDSNYTATYYPWVLTRDSVNNTQVYIPPTAEVTRNLALTDNIAFPWFASAGYTRGLVNSIKARKKLTQDDRDILYKGRINPIATFSDVGTVIWGNKTLQVKESALDRLNVRRLLLQARKLISAVAVRLLFEQNDEIVRQQFLDSVNPILDSIRRDRGLIDFRVVVQNTPEDLDANQLVGKIYLKPTRALEFIDIEFLITPTGASFEDI